MDLNLNEPVEVCEMTLDEALQKLNNWKVKNPSFVSAQSQAVEFCGRLFHPSRLNELTKEKFKNFLLFKNNKHWTGIHRQSGKITEDMDRLKSTLAILLDESKPLKGRLDTLFPPREKSRIKGLGRAVATPILMVVYPEKYGVYNRISEAGLETIELLPKFKLSDPFSKRYLAVNNVLLGIASERNVPLYLVDTMFSIVVNGEPPPAEVIQVTGQEVTDTELSEPHLSVTFALEKHLEDFLIENWDKTLLAEHLELYEEDGEIAQQFGTDVGTIDILARDKRNKGWVVLELKKGHDSDKVLGQVLRYMGWIRKRKAQPGESVRGIIIAGQSDPRLEYALQAVEGVELYVYTVDFKLREHELA